MMPTHFLIFFLQCLFPIFDSGAFGGSEYVGVSIVNTDTQAREYTVSATNPAGTVTQTGRVTLNGGAERAFLLNEVVSGAPGSGWIRIDSAANRCTAYLATGDADALAGTDSDSAGSTSLLLPHVRVNTGFVELAQAETRILIVNAGTTAANVSLSLAQIVQGGPLIPPAQLVVPPNGSRTVRISETFAASLPNNNVAGKTYDGYIRLSSDVPVSAWQRIDMPLARNMLRAVPVPSSLSRAVIPHFVIGGSVLYQSVVNIVNPASTVNVVELRAVNDQGGAIGETVQLTLQPGERRVTTVDGLFRIVIPAIFPPPIITGYISIRQTTGNQTGPPVFATVEISATINLGNSASLLYPMSDANSTNWILPFAASSSSYFSGYAIVNANELLNVQNEVVVEVVNSAGGVVSRSVYSLSPSTRQTAIIPPGLTSGYVRITSSGPIHVVGSIGTTNSNLLDSITAIPR